MAIPHNKESLTKAIKDNYAKLEKDLSDIPAVLSTKKDLEGHAKGTKMSVSNLIAYLIGWGELVLKWHHLDTLGKEIDFPETGFKWTELGLLAQKFYKDYEEKSFEELLVLLKSTVDKLLQLVEDTSNEKLYEVPWYGKYPFGRMIQLNSASPYKNARARVRKWKKQLK